jgi:hypothetical protein
VGRKKKKRKQRHSEPPATAPAPAAASEPAAASALADAPAPPSAPAEPTVVVADTPPAPPQDAPPPTPPRETASTDSPSDGVGVDLDAELDGDGESYDSLVAAVAGMEEETPTAAASDRSPAGAEEAEEVLDLDDDADVAVGSVQKLIAEVGREAPEEARTDDFDDDVPVIDLDDDVPPRAVAPRGQVAATPASPVVERLARAAAAGGMDDPEPPPIPLDLFGDVSTPEARARLLAEALAHAEHKEARYRVPVADTRRAARVKSAVAALLLVLAVFVAVTPPAWVRPQPPAQLSEAARARGIRLALLLQAHQVEAHRVRAQELPASLDELPVRLDGMRYTRSGRSYQLVAFMPDGTPVVYDAADPSPAFQALQATLTAVAAP